MGYVKIDDNFFRHPKAIRAERDGRMLFIAGICYCGNGLTDGFIPEGAIALLAAETGITKARMAAERLLDVGLWNRVDGGYEVHDYLDYNTASEKVHAERDAARERMRQKRSPEVRPNNSRSSTEVRQPETEVETERSKELNSSLEREDGQSQKPITIPIPKETRIPDEFNPDDDMSSWATAKGFSPPEIDHHTEAFVSYWRGEGGPKSKKRDWRQAWQTWLLREKPGRWPGADPQARSPNGTVRRTGGAAHGGMTPQELDEYAEELARRGE